MRRSIPAILVLMVIVCPIADAAAPPQEGLILWLDAADVDGDGNPANNPAVGQPLARWADKSSAGNHLQQSQASGMPVIAADASNGSSVVRFEGDDRLVRDRFSGLGTGDQPFHVLIVMRAPGEFKNTAQRILDFTSVDDAGTAPDRRGFWVGFQNGRKLTRLGIRNGDEGEGRNVAWDGEFHLLELVYQSEALFEMYFDGRRERRASLNGTHFLGFLPQISFAVGQHAAGGNENTYFQGDLGEVLFYNRPLNTLQRHEIGEWLTEKYSLTTDFPPIPQFEADIRPILAAKCFGCHGSETREAELDLRTVSSMLVGGEAGPVIVRGHPEYSELIAQIEAGQMPPEDEARLTDDEISRLRSWIEADAPAAEQVVIKPPASKVTPEIRKHWAWNMPVRPEPPAVRQTDRVRNEIDRFILHKLEQQNLTFSAEASPETLVRRLYFNLTGLPPSPSDIDRYLNDPEPGAYERLVDRLLDSEHFGERWGRYWLDVAGYVDVHGSDNDFAIIKPLPGKWQYRDYVIRSFNEDKPFDQFLTEQLAGDELVAWRSASQFTPEMREKLIATTFLLSANDDSSQNELNTPDIRHHVLQRTSENVASCLLAVTLQCAKCHDHKYEAISQYDYYAFESVFAPVFNVRHWVTAEKRLRPGVSDAEKAQIDASNATIQKQVDALTTRRNEIRSKHREAIFQQKLTTLPAEIREAVATAVKTSADQRSEKQKALAEQHGAAVAVTDAEISSSLDEEARNEIAGIDQTITELNGKRKTYDQFTLAVESGVPTVTHVLRRGNYLRPGLEVEPMLPALFREDGPASPLSAPDAVGATSGRRLALARRLTDSDSLAGRYVARVIVNRLWQQLFGRGIVETSDNFGVSGSAPSHPELLDWLTMEFIRGGWRVKPIIKTMLMSSAWRQTAKTGLHSQQAEAVDPGNRLLWRMNLRRLDSEQVRDAILAVSGKLERRIGGPPLELAVLPTGMVNIKKDSLADPESEWRRSIYVMIRRNYQLTMLRMFDQPIVTRNCTRRKPSASVIQSLTLLHDDFVVQQADEFADRVLRESPEGDSEALVATAFRIALGRKPHADELVWCMELLNKLANSDESPAAAKRDALAHLCHILINTNEFLYLQ